MSVPFAVSSCGHQKRRTPLHAPEVRQYPQKPYRQSTSDFSDATVKSVVFALYFWRFPEQTSLERLRIVISSVFQLSVFHLSLLFGK